jgi:hypothetical protein
MEIATIERAAAAEGLTLRGAFHPGPADAVPDLADGRRARTLVLLGNAGPALWPAFAAAPESADGAPDPLNRWSARVIGALAEALDARPLFPFGGPPYRPFVAWAKRAERIAESPLGMLIHPEHGLWHAYRGALAFAEEIAPPAPDPRPRPCDGCAARPCLAACPVGAFTTAGYDVDACAAHVAAPAGADCLALGCRARHACPVGAARRYRPAQARFHMAAFLAARSAEAAP